ncbi:hypothetical protein [Streptomyces malaysiensis]|uniref:hypothetical protein n=1 Tax=Streptomyces malaysiensis TaxID=92644 RepID=UPI0036B94AB4
MATQFSEAPTLSYVRRPFGPWWSFRPWRIFGFFPGKSGKSKFRQPRYIQFLDFTNALPGWRIGKSFLHIYDPKL